LFQLSLVPVQISFTKSFSIGLISIGILLSARSTAIFAWQTAPGRLPVSPASKDPSVVFPPYISGYVLLPDETQHKAAGIEVRLFVCEGDCPVGQVGSGSAGAIWSGMSVMTEDDGHFSFTESHLASVSAGGFTRLYLNIALEGYTELTQEVHASTPGKNGYLHSNGNALMLNRGPSDGLNLSHREPLPLTRVEALREELVKQYNELAVREYEQGLRDMLKDKTESAAGHFKKATQSAPTFYDAWMQLGAIQKEGKHLDDAAKSYSQAAEVNPNAGEPLIGLAAVSLDQAVVLEAAAQAGAAQAKYLDAATQLKQAVAKAPWSSDAYYYLGSAFYKLNQFVEAESSLKTALEKTDPRQDARLMLVNLFLKQKRYAEALAQLDAYVAAAPDGAQKASAIQLQATLRKALQP
jgi:tetratricopeptide (TPR) repeat protein